MAQAQVENGVQPVRALAAAESARAELDRRNQALAAQVSLLDQRLRDAEHARTKVEQRHGEAVERLAALERALTEERQRPAPAAPGETAPPDGPRVEAALREVSRLRDALERSEEQLWETKGQLLLDRERMAVLEHELGNAVPPPSEPTITEAAHQSIMKSVLSELGELEISVRSELGRLDAALRMIEGWREDLAVTDADVAFTGVNRTSIADTSRRAIVNRKTAAGSGANSARETVGQPSISPISSRLLRIVAARLHALQMSGSEDLVLFAHLLRKPNKELDLERTALLIAEAEYPGLDIARYVGKAGRTGSRGPPAPAAQWPAPGQGAGVAGR